MVLAVEKAPGGAGNDISTLLDVAKTHLPYVPEALRGVRAVAGWEGATWLGHSSSHRKGSWQCKACKVSFGSWKWSNFKRHHRSKAHQQQVFQIVGVDVRDLALSQPAFPGCPSPQAFAAVWKRLREGNAPNQGCEGVGARGKVWRMQCCIAEAMFAIDREFLKGSGTPGETVVALHRDEKNGRLQVDFTVCNSALQTRTGTMGIISNKGGTFGIVQSIVDIFERFWTDICGARDHDGLELFKTSIEVLNTDAAADEISASREQTRPSSTSDNAVTPNVKIIARDRAHGTQRCFGVRSKLFGVTVGMPLRIVVGCLVLHDHVLAV